MEEVLTGVFSLGEVSMAEIVSLSQCPIGIGPCCLRMSARALGRHKKKGGKKCIFTRLKFSVCACTACESRSSWVSTINRKKNSNNNKIKIWLKSSASFCVSAASIFRLAWLLFGISSALSNSPQGYGSSPSSPRADKLLLAHEALPPAGATAGPSPDTS